MQENTRNERVLIVLAADGSIAGISLQRLQTFTDDAGNNIIPPQELPPVPLTTDVLASVLPDCAALLAQISDLQYQLADANEKLTANQQIATTA